MENIKSNEAIATEQVAQLEDMTQQIEVLEEQLRNALLTLEEIRKQTKEPEQIEETISEIKKSQTALETLKNFLNKIRDNLVNAIKENNIKALDKIVRFTQIDKLTAVVNKNVERDSANIKKTIAYCEKVSIEANSIGRHVANLGKAIIGKEVKTGEIEASKLALMPLVALDKGYVKWQASTEQSMNKLAELSANAAQLRGENQQVVEVKTKQEENIEQMADEQLVEKVTDKAMLEEIEEHSEVTYDSEQEYYSQLLEDVQFDEKGNVIAYSGGDGMDMAME